jgi:hypothetical protein
MLLPPQGFAEIDGLKRYSAQPSLDDKWVGRSGNSIATRVNAATYTLERPGDYALSTIDVRSFNVGTSTLEVAQADAVPFHVAVNSNLPGPPERTWTWSDVVGVVVERWPIVLAVVAGLAAIAWFAPSAVHRIAAAVRRRRIAHLQSEAWAYRRLRTACSANMTYARLLAWLQAVGPDRSIAA